jgi:proteic killer suppression protein
MKISYKPKKLEKTVESLSVIKTTYGTRAKLVNQRKNELEAATSLHTMRFIPAANCHALTGNYEGKFAVDISGNHRIIFEPNHNPLPLTPDGGLDWSLVTDITIVAIGLDYHKK